LTTKKPCRLRLSRRPGFDLQRESLERNGLPAVNVSRPSRWGNPFVAAKLPGGAAEAVARFRAFAADRGFRAAARAALSGKNLACWCAPGQPCHADILLEIVNEGKERDRPSAAPLPMIGDQR
jgi:hypothetical protein